MLHSIGQHRKKDVLQPLDNVCVSATTSKKLISGVGAMFGFGSRSKVFYFIFYFLFLFLFFSQTYFFFQKNHQQHIDLSLKFPDIHCLFQQLMDPNKSVLIHKSSL